MKLSAFFLAGAMLLSAPGALAQNKNKGKNPDEEKVAKAKELFEKADTFYKLQKYEDALKGYEEVYLLYPKPELLYNIGQCYRLLGKRDEAIRSYKTFLQDAPPGDLRNDALGFVQALEAEQERATTALTPPTPATTPTTAQAPTETRPQKSPPYGLFAGGAITAAGFVLGGLSLRAASQTQELSQFSSGSIDTAELQQAFTRGRSLAASADVFIVAGLVTSGLSLVIHKKKEQQ